MSARYDVRIVRGHAWCLFDLRGPSERILPALAAAGLPQPVEPNRRLTGEVETAVARLGPTRWLLRAPISAEAQLAARLSAMIDSMADADMALVTDQFELFRLIGPGAGDVVAQGTALDIASAEFGADAMTSTEMFGAGVLLDRGVDGFLITIERSFGDWMERWLHAAAGLSCAITPANRVTDDKRQRSL
jgi:heterotetrameric sarcosine oxidase gamma subunit